MFGLRDIAARGKGRREIVGPGRLPPLTPSGSFRIGSDTGGGTLYGVTPGAKVKSNIPGITVDNSELASTIRTYSGTPTGSAGPNAIAFYSAHPDGRRGYTSVMVLPNPTPFAVVTTVVGFWSADMGVTEAAGLVSEWINQVGQGHVVAQATSASRPVLDATAFAGLPALSFDGTDDYLEFNGTINFPAGTSTGEIFVLCSNDDPASNNVSRRAFSYGPSGATAGNTERGVGRTVVSSVNRARAIFGTGSGSNQVIDTERQLDGFHFMHADVDSGSQISIDVDFYPEVTAASSTSTGTPTRIRIGSSTNDTPGVFWKGKIRAVIVAAGMSAGDMTAVGNWRSDNMGAFMPTAPQGFARNPPLLSTSSGYATRSHQLVPSIAITGNRIWSTFYCQQGLTTSDNPERAGNYCVISYSDDDGASWTEAQYVLPNAASKERVFDPQLFTLPDGRLLFMASASFSTADTSYSFDGVGGCWAVVIGTPETSPSYSAPVWLWDGVPGQPQMFGNEVRLIVDQWQDIGAPARKPHFAKRAGRHLMRLIYDEPTPRLEYLSTIPAGSSSKFIFDETTVVRHYDGSNVAIWRGLDGPYVSSQADDFAAWSEPALYTTFPAYTVSSRHAMAVAPSGERVFVWNNGSTRTNMSIAVLSLAGVWSPVYTFDTRTWVTYPVIAFKGDTAYVIYDFERGFLGGKAKDIVMQIIPLASVRAGAGTKTTRTVSV